MHSQFHFSGSGHWRASARGNAIRGQQCGRNSVRFSRDGAAVSWELPPLLLRGARPSVLHASPCRCVSFH
jgi:hypothetical protein